MSEGRSILADERPSRRAAEAGEPANRGRSHIPKAGSRAEQVTAGSRESEVRSRKQKSGAEVRRQKSEAVPSKSAATLCHPRPPRSLLPAPRSLLPASSRGGPGRRGQARGRLYALPGAGEKSHADRFWRRQSARHAGLHRRGPGADEDRQGEPFVGRAGQLLTDIITKGMKLRREDVYIMNILRCRPPDNRTPLPDEAANCREYLDAQLAIIQPQYICCLGACAAQNLLGVDTAIGKLRGRLIDFQRHEGPVHLPPGLRAAQSAGKEAGVGGYSGVDEGDGDEV